MGGRLWTYFVPYEASVQSALEKLRHDVFMNHEFRGRELLPKTIEEALLATAPQGTASILDILLVSKDPTFCAITPLSADELDDYFGTQFPTREMIQADNGFHANIDRGQGVYFIVYDEGRPTEYYFAGYSFD